MPPRVKKIVITEIPDVVENPIFDEPEDNKPIKIAKVRKPRVTKAKIITPVEIEKELEKDHPIVFEPIAAQVPNTPDNKKKYSRNPTQYNILVGEFLKKISIDDKDKSEKMSGTSRLKKAQEMYRQWKIDNPTTNNA
jgi:hypothetical protein